MTRGIKHTKESVNESISHTGFQLVGEYTRAHIKTTFRCPEGHKWQARPCDVLSGGGCPHCDTIARTLTTEIVNERISSTGVTLEGEYLGVHIRSKFKCQAGHEFQTTPDYMLRGGVCSSCRTVQGSGYKQHLPGWAYILEFDTFIKYGITNDPARRLAKHDKAGKYSVRLLDRYSDGALAYQWEQTIKSKFGGKFVDRTVMPDGFTETLSKDLLESVCSLNLKGGE